MPQCCEPSSNKQPWLVWPLISPFQCSISLKWDKHTGRGEVITKIEQHSNGVGPWPPIISTTSPTDLYSPSSKGDKQRDQWRSSRLTSDNHQDFPIHSNGVTLWPRIISALSLTIHSLPSKWDKHKARSWRWSFCIHYSMLCQNKYYSQADQVYQ